MVQSFSISITPANHADRHRHGGADPLTGDVRVVTPPFNDMVDVSGSRAINTIYQNTTDYPKFVSLNCQTQQGRMYVKVGAATPPTSTIFSAFQTTNLGSETADFIIPPGYYYQLSFSIGGVIDEWFEST